MLKIIVKCLFLLCVSYSLGCTVNLPFNNRLDYSYVNEAKRLTTSKNEPISLEWSPADFPNRVDIQGASGFVGGGSQTRIPTGVALASRITEALDSAVGVDKTSKRVLEIYILSAQSKFEYSAGMANITPGIDYAWCNVEAELSYNGTTWKDSFTSEERDETIGGSSQTGLLERVWDKIALQLTKNVVSKIEQLPKNDSYKDSEGFKQKKSERDLKLKEAAKKREEENRAWAGQYKR